MSNTLLFFNLGPGDLFGGWSPRFIFLALLVTIGLGLFLLRLVVNALFGAIVIGCIGYLIAGETGAGIGAILGLLAGIMNSMEDLENKKNSP